MKIVNIIMETLMFAVSLLIIVIVFIIICFGICFIILKDREGEYKHEVYEYVNPQSNESIPFNSIHDDAEKYLSVVIPAYNEEERISIMLNETIEYLSERQKKDSDFTWELIIVDDGSRDQTVKLVQQNYVLKYGTDLIRVNKLKKNVGKGGAVRRGALVSRGKIILMADADGATTFSDFKKLEDCIHNIQKNGLGVIVGSRAQYHEEIESERRPWYRNISHIVFALLVDTLCVKGVKDTQCGFKLFTRKSAKEIFLSLHIERWAFDVEALYISQRKNHPIGEEIVQWAEIDGSHLSVVSASLQMFKDIIRVPLLYRLGIWKLYTN